MGSSTDRGVVLLALLAAVACGRPSPPTTAPSFAAPPPATVRGVAAGGVLLPATIQLRDAAARERSLETSDGSYSFDVTDLTPPFLLTASWTSDGAARALRSIAAGPGAANVNPLSELAVRAAAGDRELAPLGPASLSAVADALPSALDDLRDALAPLLARYAADVDPVAADDAGLARLLDEVEFSFGAGAVTLTDAATGTFLFGAPTADVARGVSALAWSRGDALAAGDPAVAVDGDGNALVLWVQADGRSSDVMARWLDGSAAAVRVSDGVGLASYPRVAIDGAGRAVAAWAQYDGGRNRIWASRYVPGIGWEAARAVSTSSAADAGAPDLGIDAAGNAIAAWGQGSGVVNHFDVQVSRLDAASGAWSAPATLSDGVESAHGPRVAVAAGGDAVVVWAQDESDGSISNAPQDVYARSYAPDIGWGVAARLNAVAGSTAAVYGQVAVALDAAGNGLALWVQQGEAGAPFAIWAAELVPGSGWTPAAVLTAGATGDCYGPEVLFGADGHAVAAWQQQTGTSAFVASSRYDLATGWAEWQVVSGGAAAAYDPHLAVDAAGNATAVWYEMDLEAGRYTVEVSRAAAAGAWAAPQLLGAIPIDASMSYPVPRIAGDAHGRSFVVWGVDAM
jgi:hypothetical protein